MRAPTPIEELDFELELLRAESPDSEDFDARVETLALDYEAIGLSERASNARELNTPASEKELYSALEEEYAR